MTNRKEQAIKLSNLIESYIKHITFIHNQYRYRENTSILRISNRFYSIQVEPKMPGIRNQIIIDSLEQIEDYLGSYYNFVGFENIRWDNHQLNNYFRDHTITNLFITVPAVCQLAFPLDKSNNYTTITSHNTIYLEYTLQKHKNHFLLFVEFLFRNSAIDISTYLDVKAYCFIFNEKAERVSIEQRIELMEFWINESILQNM